MTGGGMSIYIAKLVETKKITPEDANIDFTKPMDKPTTRQLLRQVKGFGNGHFFMWATVPVPPKIKNNPWGFEINSVLISYYQEENRFEVINVGSSNPPEPRTHRFTHQEMLILYPDENTRWVTYRIYFW
jgi:hypothetical protein